MSDEINIFNNLEEMMKCNFLAQIRTMGIANNSTECQSVDDSFEDFDEVLNNNVKHSPTKRIRNQSLSEGTIREKKLEESVKVQSSTTLADMFLTQPLQLKKKMNDIVANNVGSRRGRKSVGRNKNATVSTPTCNNAEIFGDNKTPPVVSASEAGRGGRGRGTGKNRGRRTRNNPKRSSEYSLIDDDSFEQSNDEAYIPDSEVSLASNLENTSANLNSSEFPNIGGRLRTMRKRRNCVAELAARCPVIDSVDLVSSPLPRVEGFIDLDTDEDDTGPRTRNRKKNVKNTTLKKDPVLDISFDDDNPELSVKINWKGKPEAFKLRKYQKFSTIFNILAEREGTDIESIVFNLNERIILPDDTPESIGYKIFHFISGRVLTTNVTSPLGPAGVPKKKRNPNEISLKIQSDRWKRPLQVYMKKADKFRVLFIKCAEELNIGIEQIKLSFDGEYLGLNDTPDDLEFEGGEAIDLRLKN